MYLHIGQQTDEKPIMHEQVEKFSRETQLCSLRNQSWNTKREAFTQMDRHDLVLDSTFDHSCIPGRYVGSKEWEEKRDTACINIQRYVRRWIAICQYKRLQNYAQEMHVFFVEQEKIELAEAEECIRREINRRKHPRALSDFLILYEELASWHVEEVEKIHAANLDTPERTNAMKELLLKEVKLLYAIDKLKARALKENHEDGLKKLMLKISAPKIWELTNGKIVHVRTPGTARASDLMHLYMALAKKYTSIDERMGILGYVKWTIQEFDCSLSKEILLLIEREADLMYRNRPPKSLVGLRQRILQLFLQFLNTPKFNPEAVAYQNIPMDFDFSLQQSLARRNPPS